MMEYLPMTNRPSPLTLTDAAAERVKTLMATLDKPAFGLRVGVNSSGCAGMSYSIDFVEEKQPMDEVVETKGVTLLVDPKAFMYILGTEMDYVEDKMQSSFVFNNPNVKSQCGCGESFSV
jgi:iron-sulfur cluster assembly protein